MADLKSIVFSILILSSLILSSCGSDPNSKQSSLNQSVYNGPTGSAKLIVHNPISANSSESYGAIKLYRAAVSGEGIEAPIPGTQYLIAAYFFARDDQL